MDVLFYGPAEHTDPRYLSLDLVHSNRPIALLLYWKTHGPQERSRCPQKGARRPNKVTARELQLVSPLFQNKRAGLYARKQDAEQVCPARKASKYTGPKATHVCPKAAHVCLARRPSEYTAGVEAPSCFFAFKTDCMASCKRYHTLCM